MLSSPSALAWVSSCFTRKRSYHHGLPPAHFKEDEADSVTRRMIASDEKANKAPEPATLPVTIPAEPGIAPVGSWPSLTLGERREQWDCAAVAGFLQSLEKREAFRLSPASGVRCCSQSERSLRSRRVKGRIRVDPAFISSAIQAVRAPSEIDQVLLALAFHSPHPCISAYSPACSQDAQQDARAAHGRHAGCGAASAGHGVAHL